MGKKGGGAKVAYYSDGAGLEVVMKRFYDMALKKFDDRFDHLLRVFNEKLLERTPVWSGDMIHNWRWSTRSPDGRHEEPIEEPFFAGKTSNLALGEEPRRPANVTRPRQSLAGALRAREPMDIYLTNTSEHAAEIEAGLMPSRADPGFLRLTLKEVFGGYA